MQDPLPVDIADNQDPDGTGGTLEPHRHWGNAIDRSSLRRQQTGRSALWAAWADSLGFISELTGEAGLSHRLRGRRLIEPVDWVRRVGGRGGPDKLLPAGTYSDDTQLRLSVGRCLSAGGFDANAFAHIELPGWLAYALGGGLATRAAANGLMRPNTAWYGTHPDGWIQSGGNGAAMRIQPHVWMAPDPTSNGPWLSGLLTDATTTHAHPRALIGATLHAYALGAVLTTGEVLAPSYWPDLLAAAAQDARVALSDHPELSEYWLPAYDLAAAAEGAPSFDEAWNTIVEEVRGQLLIGASIAEMLPLAEIEDDRSATADAAASAYNQLVSEFSLKDPKRRGSGTATVVAALVLAVRYPGRPDIAALIAARAVETDTDTIATMAAALAGASSAATELPPLSGFTERERGAGLAAGDFADRDYVLAEAWRLADVASGNEVVPAMRYPDLLGWEGSKSQVDLIGDVDGQVVLAGLSVLTPAEDEVSKSGGFGWRWFTTAWGQHVIGKLRLKLRPLPSSLSQTAAAGRREDANKLVVDPPQSGGASRRPAEVRQQNKQTRANRQAVVVIHEESHVLGEQSKTNDVPATSERPQVDVSAMLDWVARKNYTDSAIGLAVRRVRDAVSLEEFVEFARQLGDQLDDHSRRDSRHQ